jgi:hypothetical protein
MSREKKIARETIKITIKIMKEPYTTWLKGRGEKGESPDQMEKIRDTLNRHQHQSAATTKEWRERMRIQTKKNASSDVE